MLVFDTIGGLQLESSSSLSNARMEANVGVILEEVLEEAPKWKVLRVSE